MTSLARPSVQYKDSFIEGIAEFHEEGRLIDLSISALQADFESYVSDLLYRETHPRPGLVPETIYWIVDDAGFIGRISLRHELNQHLRSYGGHIGYEIRPSRRQQGHGTRALTLVLAEARKLGLERVLITCDTTNTGSRKIIEANGGVLEDIIKNAFNPVPTMRWWIDLTTE